MQIDSFYSIVFPDDPLIWKTDMAPLGKAREWVEQNKQRPRAAFWTAEVGIYPTLINHTN